MRWFRFKCPSRVGCRLKARTTTRFILLLVVTVSVAYWAHSRSPSQRDKAADAQTRFGWLDVSIDSANQPLGAYQFELAVENGNASVVGLEGGNHPAFASAPYYDPAALRHSRVIVAAYSVAADLPTGKTRVARVMIETRGEAGFAVKLIKAFDKEGQEIQAKVDFTQGVAR